MSPKFFLLPALASVLAFTVLVVNHQVSHAQDCVDCGGGGCAVLVCDAAGQNCTVQPGNCGGDPPGGGGGGGGGGGDPEPPETCPADSTSVGAISASAIKTAPFYPMVIGQDDTRRGADISCVVTVEPSTKTTYSNNAAGKCVSHVETYAETATSQVTVSLDSASRDWILNGDLQTRYPGAFLHNPVISLGSCGDALNAQIADPGRFVINVTGETSGTPIQGPRSFSIDAGEFLAYLREIVITR